MLEQWNNGLGETGTVIIGKTLWTTKLINEKLPCKIIPGNDGIFDIPTFHYSIIPCARQYTTASKNSFNLNKL